MKKNLFKFLLLIVGLIFTVGCEMTLSFNDYDEARNKTRSNTQITNSNDSTSGNTNTVNPANPSSTNTTKPSEGESTTKSSSTNMTRNVFDVVFYVNGQEHKITVERWNNENLPDYLKEGFIIVDEFGNQQQIIGYYTDPNYRDSIDLNTAHIDNDIEIYVKLEKIEPLPDKVTITYVSNGGVDTQAIVVDRGTKIASSHLPQITKIATDDKRFIFGGWYYDVDFVLKVERNDEINKDTTIYAKWREVVKSGLFEYTESEDLTEWYITSFIGKKEDTPENLVFPTTFNGRNVTKVGCYLSGNNTKTVEVPEGYTDYSVKLRNMYELRRLTIASTVTTGFHDIDNCYRLVEIYNKSSLVFDNNDEESCYKSVHKIHTSMSEPSIIRMAGNLEIAESDRGTYVLSTKEPVPANGELVMPQYIMVDGERVYGYHIGAYLYYKNENIKKVTISKSIASVGEYSFAELPNLETIEINSVCTVKRGAFYTTSSKLKTTYLGVSGIHFESQVFYGYSMEKVFAPDFYSWTTYKFDEYNSSPMGYGSNVSLYLEDTAGTETYTFESITRNYEKYTALIIPEGTTEIGDYQFYNFKNLTEISLPNSLEKIGKYAFGLNGILFNNEHLVKMSGTSSNRTYTIKNGIVEGNCMYIGNASNPYLLFEGFPLFYSGTYSEETKFVLHSGCKFADANSIQAMHAMDEEAYKRLTVVAPSSFVQFMAGSIRIKQKNTNVLIKIGMSNETTQMKEIELTQDVIEIFNYHFIFNCNISFVVPKSVKKIYFDKNNWIARVGIYYMGTEEEWEAITKVNLEPIHVGPVFFYSKTAVADPSSGVYWYWKNEANLLFGWWGE